jgi:hypothetical protein
MGLWAWEVCCASANSEAKKERCELAVEVVSREAKYCGGWENMRTSGVNISHGYECMLHCYRNLPLHQIRRILKPIFQRHKRILDTPRTDKPRKDVKTPGLVVGPARTGASKRLLANNGACALVVVVDVAGCMTEAGRHVQQGVAVR